MTLCRFRHGSGICEDTARKWRRRYCEQGIEGLADQPALQPTRSGNEPGARGLQIVNALSDVWGWSPVAGCGKAVWAILFCE
jgi:hypothetical protein